MDMDSSSCCICFKAGPVLYKVTEKVNDNETLTPIYKLLICLPDINWPQNYQICNFCKDNLDETYDFREMCFKSEFSRCEIKVEDNKVEILDFDGDLKIETKPPLENTTFTNVCNICSNVTTNLSKISKNSNEENLSPILKLKILIQNINWSDDFDICNLCEERLNKAYNFRDLCFKSQSNFDCPAIENKQIKIKTNNNEGVEIESSSKLAKVLLDEIKLEGTIDDGHVENESRKLPDLEKPLTIVNKVGVKKVLKNECHICSKRFLFATKLERHLLLVHSNGTDLKCGQCSKELKSKQSLQRHLATIHKVGVEETLNNECPPCSRRFSSPNKLQKHLRLVHLANCDFQCEQCGNGFQTKRSLQRHLAKIHKVEVEYYTKLYTILKHECPLCLKRFPSLDELQEHVRLVHSDVSHFHCLKCDKELKSKRMLKGHLASIHKIGVKNPLKHECHLCSKRFSIAKKLTRHLRLVHSYTSDFQCEQCGQELKTKQSLQRHLAKIHKVGVDDTLNHECPVCLDRFPSPDELQKHVRLVHSDVSDFQCYKCDQELKSERMLKWHLANVHKIGVNETLKYKCRLCAKRFCKPGLLAIHLRARHLNIFDFKCEHCSKEFKAKQTLQRHLANVHKIGVEEIRKHKCHRCSERFSSPYELKKHSRKLQCDKEFK